MSTISDSSPRAARLISAARDAAEVRAALSDPNVVALKIERRRARVNLMIWAAVFAGLAFTASNVQQFAAHGAPVHSLAWWFAWLLDPTITAALIAVLLAEQTTSTWKVRTPRAAVRVKYVTLALTYAMNTWSAWAGLTSRTILLHSAPVIGVFFVVGAAPQIRDSLTRTVEAAAPVTVPVVEPEPVRKTTAPAPAPAKSADTSIPDPPPAQQDWSRFDPELRTRARTVARQLGDGLSRAKLKAELGIGTERAGTLLKLLQAEQDHRPLHAVGAE